jgi:serine phosphatase RsbU (regulator of sigma subunit)
MMLVYVRALFRQVVRETREPAAIVARLAKALYAEARSEPYLTCIVVRFDEQPRSLTFSVAGHPPALAIGVLHHRLVDGGPPAGLLPDAEYEQETIALPSGSRVVVVTDGITERLADFEAAVTAIDPRQPADALCDSIFDLSEAPDASAPVDGWDDDRTVLVMAVD